MPLHLQSIVNDEQETELFSWIVTQSANDDYDEVMVSGDKYIHIVRNVDDSLSGETVGRIVYTIKINEANKCLEIKDIDMVLNSENLVEIEFLKILEGSSESNEYYEVELIDGGQHIEVETVFRHMELEELLHTRCKVSACAFPFSINLYENISAFNAKNGFSVPIKVAGIENAVAGFSDDFACPGSVMTDDKEEHFSYLIGTAKAIKDCSLQFGEIKLSVLIVDVNTALGIIPVIMSKKVFDLSEMSEGCIIEMYADIKASILATDLEREVKNEEH